MSNNHRVLNLTRGFNMKAKQALRAIEECACEWVVEGESVRDLTLAESIAKRNEQAKLRTPLEFAELPGVVVRDIVTDYKLIHEAHEFAASHT
jgi:hypothetical protein